MPVRFYQVGSFAVGNRLVDPEDRSVQSDPGRTNSLTSGHRACQGCGEALGARYTLDAAMRATSGRMVAVERDGMPGSVLHPVPRDIVADRLAALAVRQRSGRCYRCRSRPTGQGTSRRSCGRSSRRRRHLRHRPAGPLRRGRPQRGHPLRLLRQRGVHEHRRPAQRRHPAPQARDRNDSRPSARSPAAPSGRARTLPAHRPWPTSIPYVATASGGPTCTDLAGQGRARPRRSTAPATSTYWCRAPWAGVLPLATPSHWRGWRRRRASSLSWKPSSVRSPLCRVCADLSQSLTTYGGKSAFPPFRQQRKCRAA